MKVAQFLNSDSEQVLERSGTFFYADEVMAAHERRARRKINSFIVALLVGAAMLGAGLAIVDVVPWNSGHIDRLTDELAKTERQMATVSLGYLWAARASSTDTDSARARSN